MRICKNCHREIPDDQPFCPYCCPPDANPEDNWAFAPLGDIEYIEEDSETGNRVSVEGMENVPDSELTETQQFNLAFDFNHVTLVGESSSKEPVNYLKAVSQAAPPSDEAARRKALDDIFNPIEKIFTREETEPEAPVHPARKTRSFKISPMKRPVTVDDSEVKPEPAVNPESKQIPEPEKNPEPVPEPHPEPALEQQVQNEFIPVPEILHEPVPEAEILPEEPHEISSADTLSAPEITIPESIPDTIFAFSPDYYESSDSAPAEVPVLETEPLPEVTENGLFFSPEPVSDTDSSSGLSFDVTEAAVTENTAVPAVTVPEPDSEPLIKPETADAVPVTPEKGSSEKKILKLFRPKDEKVELEKPAYSKIHELKSSGSRLIPEDIQITPREGGKGALEKELEELKEQHIDSEISRPLGPAGITVLILLIAVLLFSVGYGVYRIRSAPQNAEQALMNQIEGSWVSDGFALKDDETRRLTEIMEIKSDGSFTENCYYVDSEGNATERAYLIKGTVEAFIDDNIILSFCYDTGSGQYFFIRELISITNDGMTLREYYDESHTDSYDLVFTRKTA